MRAFQTVALMLVVVLAASRSLPGKDRDRDRDRDRDDKRPDPTPAPATQLERGKYLVHNVARCIDCHTPRDDKGDLVAARLLQGAPIWIKPAVATDDWAEHAPD